MTSRCYIHSTHVHHSLLFHVEAAHYSSPSVQLYFTGPGGLVPGPPVDVKICVYSSPLYKMAQYLHLTYTYQYTSN